MDWSKLNLKHSQTIFFFSMCMMIKMYKVWKNSTTVYRKFNREFNGDKSKNKKDKKNKKKHNIQNNSYNSINGKKESDKRKWMRVLWKIYLGIYDF